MVTQRRSFPRLALLMAISAIPVGCGDDRHQVAAQAAEAGSEPAASSSANDLQPVRLAPAFPRLTFMRPVFITHAGDGTNRLYVLEQIGQIRAFENRGDVSGAEVFLDLRRKVRTQHNEEGLLSLVFHPKYQDNGRFFVYYTASGPKRNVIAEYRVSADDPSRADSESERIILEVEHPYGNHNGSTLLFGPDGYLYASYGDGGLANDPDGNGQNLATLLGSIIRIDVDRQEEGKPYAIPNDNPFVDRKGARGEIWAYGLRNVWRMSFDRETGELWAGDVGQNAWEEIDLIVKGGNYGWDIREGSHPFESGSSSDPLIDPVAEYSHREGLSVTGGYVYRGKRYPPLQGVYIYCDYVSGRIWGLRYENSKVTAHRELNRESDRKYITSFGEDAEGELYICAFDRLDGGRGRIYRLIAE